MVLDGPHGLVHAAFRASGALVLVALLAITGDFLFSGLHCCFFDLRAYAGHVYHPSLSRAFLPIYEVVFMFCFIFGLAFGLVVHRCSFPSTALQTPRLLVGRADHVPDGYAAFCSGTLHLGEIDTEFLGLLLGRIRGVRLLLVLHAGGLLTLLGSLNGGVLRLLGRSLRDLLHLLLGLLQQPPCPPGLPEALRIPR
jgi:hypothetical protein